MEQTNKDIMETRILVTCELLSNAWSACKYLSNFCARTDEYSGFFSQVEAECQDIKRLKNRLMEIRNEIRSEQFKVQQHKPKRWYQFWR